MKPIRNPDGYYSCWLNQYIRACCYQKQTVGDIDNYQYWWNAFTGKSYLRITEHKHSYEAKIDNQQLRVFKLMALAFESIPADKNLKARVYLVTTNNDGSANITIITSKGYGESKEFNKAEFDKWLSFGNNNESNITSHEDGDV